jgi:quinol monooxygenase YgiN
MIVEYIRYQVANPAAFVDGYRTASKSLDASSHCLGYELCQCDEDDKAFILRIEWDSADGHMKGFRSSPEFRAFFAAIAPWVGDIAEMRHYHPTEVARSKA